LIERDLDTEFSSNEERKYVYDFDSTIRFSLLNRVNSLLDRTGKTLEIGAFEGLMTRQILERFSNLSVLEGSPLLAEGIRNHFAGEVLVTSSKLEDAVFEPTFRNIFLVHTLEHLDNPVSSLSRIGSWLAPDGVLVVAVPNANALSRQIATHMGLMENVLSVTNGERLQGHQRTYNLELLMEDVIDAGLCVIDSGGVIVKPLSNSQFDLALSTGLISDKYVRACEAMSLTYPDLCATIYVCVARSN
jgi:hypothetical protein